MAANEHGAQQAGSGGGLGLDPMHQFEIKRLIPIDIGSFDISITNSTVWMLIILVLAGVFLLMGGNRLVPSRWQSVKELTYEFVANMMRDIVGDAGRAFFPFVFTLFIFILFANMLGMVPYSFTVTSHIIVTFAMALFVFVLATVVGFVKHGAGYLRMFVPSGVPPLMLPVLVPIEIISYFTRPLSLSVRLFANMMAGHTMLKVFAGFVVALGFLGGWAPLAMMVALTGLEVLVAFLQAYVFAVLTVIYLNDAINMHH